MSRKDHIIDTKSPSYPLKTVHDSYNAQKNANKYDQQNIRLRGEDVPGMPNYKGGPGGTNRGGKTGREWKKHRWVARKRNKNGKWIYDYGDGKGFREPTDRDKQISKNILKATTNRSDFTRNTGRSYDESLRLKVDKVIDKYSSQARDLIDNTMNNINTNINNTRNNIATSASQAINRGKRFIDNFLDDLAK